MLTEVPVGRFQVDLPSQTTAPEDTVWPKIALESRLMMFGGHISNAITALPSLRTRLLLCHWVDAEDMTSSKSTSGTGSPIILSRASSQTSLDALDGAPQAASTNALPVREIVFVGAGYVGEHYVARIEFVLTLFQAVQQQLS